MGILSKIFDVGGEAAKPIEAIATGLDGLFTSDEERLDKQTVLERLRQQPGKWQTIINQIEAQHRSVFVAGWRPFVGWVCGLSLAYNYIARDLLAWLLSIFAPSVTMPPALAMEHLMTILAGMLGLGGLRTFEKLKGRAK